MCFKGLAQVKDKSSWLSGLLRRGSCTAGHLLPAYRLLRGSIDIDGGNASGIHAAESSSLPLEIRESPEVGAVGAGLGTGGFSVRLNFLLDL